MQTLFLDPINGSDSNDGSTVAKAMKTMEALVSIAGISATKVLLLNNLTISGKVGVNCALQILGAQQSSTGYIIVQRQITFLGTANNSPDTFNNYTFCSGLYLGGASFSTNYIDFSLPDQPSGQTFPAHFVSQNGTTVTFLNGTLLVNSAKAGQLFAAVNSKSAIFWQLALGANATGHLFTGVAAGVNPNNYWQYDTNLTSA